MTSTPPEHFETLYRADPDPWGFATSTYERAKYARTIRALGGRRYGRALELGCSIGVMTQALSALCDELVACDAAPTAVAAARERVAGRSGVEVVEAVLPDDLPNGPWDLVVASEVLYYLDEEGLDTLLQRLEDDLRPGGVFLAVHWTRATRTHPQQGDQVHEALLQRPAFARTLGERRDPYRLDRFTRR